MDTNKEILKLSNEQEWNHQYYLPGGLKTRKTDINSPGYNINKWKRLKPLFENSLINQTSFLDVGCSDGYYSIEIAKLKKSFQVTGIDIDDIRIERSNLMKKIFNVTNVEFYKEDLYNLINNKQNFDVVIALGLLHRVPSMNKCIEDLSKLSNKYILFEFKSYKSDQIISIRHQEKTKSNKFNKLYETPSIKYVIEQLKIHNFKNFTILEDSESHLNFPRTIILGEK